MLIYLFWHWSYPQIKADEYESNLAAFHKTLHDLPPSGFQYSSVVKTEGVSWGNPNGSTYQDWYGLTDATALDTINKAAVNDFRLESHNRAARQAQDGTASLYQLHTGDPTTRPTDTLFQLWFGKPTDLSYTDFFRVLQPITDAPKVRLWQRFMTLGPSPEFCLLSPSPLTLPDIVTSGLYLSATSIY